MKKTVKRVDIVPGVICSRQIKDVAWKIFHYQYFDGIIVCVNATDLPFYGTALTLMLKNFRRPVVLFSREEQAEEASRWAELGQAGIFALGDDGLDLACRITCEETGRLYSVCYPQVGKKEGKTFRILKELLPPEEQDPFLMCDALNERVAVLYPGDVLEEHSELTKVSGAVICLKGEADLRWLFEEQMSALLLLHKKGVPVVVSGLPERFENPQLRRQLLLSGIISAGDMTREATIVKLMWTLARTHSVDGVKLYFSLSFGGEMTQR